MNLINIATIILMCIGLLFFVGAVVGVLRFPDFFTRIHAASKGDTLSSLVLLIGFALFLLQDFTLANVLVSLKLLLIMVFMFIASPTAAHALVEAAYAAGAKPWLREQTDQEENRDQNEG